MQKIQAIFVIDRTVNMATREINQSCQWVFDGEGVATIRHDGTPVLFKNGRFYKRWNRKLQKKYLHQWRRDRAGFKCELDMFKELPEDAIAIEDAPAPITLHFPYWGPVVSGKEDLFFREAIGRFEGQLLENTTFEVVGPKVQGNPYDLECHELRRHGGECIEINDYGFDALRELFQELDAEGIVWHHPDGRMAKLRRSHFNLFWNRSDLRDDHEARAAFVA